jgi:photosystem II stability/assembly factor-like uncharacterized protein
MKLHLATRKGLFTLERNASILSISRVDFAGDNCSMVLHDHRYGVLYAALDHGHFGVKLHRSRDDGESWQEIAVPVYPEKPADYATAKRPFEGPDFEWSLQKIWALETGGPAQAGRLWCGTLPGGLFVSDDGGDSWELNQPLWDEPPRAEWFGGGMDVPAIHSICVHPKNPDHITIGVSCGGVWITEDGGNSWHLCGRGMVADFMPAEIADNPNVQDVHRLTQCASSPDHLWVQHHNGIFKSEDGAASWSEITEAGPSTFGFATVVHPEDPNTAWFVPGIKDEKRMPVDARLVVTRTRDGGKTFDVLREGLPQEHSYDIVLRHAMDIDASGDVLAIGSTTGNLWISENGGDLWQAISQTLPPIYAVRFTRS